MMMINLHRILHISLSSEFFKTTVKGIEVKLKPWLRVVSEDNYDVMVHHRWYKYCWNFSHWQKQYNLLHVEIRRLTATVSQSSPQAQQIILSIVRLKNGDIASRRPQKQWPRDLLVPAARNLK